MLTSGCILRQTKINQRHFSWVFGALLAWFKLDIHMSVCVIMMLDILHSCSLDLERKTKSLCWFYRKQRDRQSVVNADYVWTHKNNISFRFSSIFQKSIHFLFLCFFCFWPSLCLFVRSIVHTSSSHITDNRSFDTCGFPEGRHAITKKYKNVFKIAYKLLSE